MNPLCFVCQELAVKVCQHPECSFPPFLCDGSCTRQISKKMHTHTGVQNFIPFGEFQQRVEEIKRTLDPQALHKEFLEQMNKKVILAKDHLQQQIHSLDKVYEQLENDLCVELSIQLKKECQTVFVKIDSDLNGESLTGKDLVVLLSEQKFVQQRETLAAIESVKEGFLQGLKRVDEVRVEGMFMRYTDRVNKSKVLYGEGNALRQQKKYKQALQKYREAIKINNWDYMIHFWIGFCLDKLNELDESQKSYKRSLELNPDDSSTLNNIGFIYQTRGNFQQAIEWYTRAIEKNGANSAFFSNRGYCYVQLKRYQQALVDYTRANKIDPIDKQSINQLEEIAKQLKKHLK